MNTAVEIPSHAYTLASQIVTQPRDVDSCDAIIRNEAARTLTAAVIQHLQARGYYRRNDLVEFFSGSSIRVIEQLAAALKAEDLHEFSRQVFRGAMNLKPDDLHQTVRIVQASTQRINETGSFKSLVGAFMGRPSRGIGRPA